MERRAILTVPREVSERCEGKRLAEIIDDQLKRHLINLARRWIEVKRLEGEEFIDKDDIHVYGPFPSMVMLEAMLSAEHMAITPKERDEITLEKGAFNHFLLNAMFAPKGGRKETEHGTEIL